jgi:hypothetical protein
MSNYLVNEIKFNRSKIKGHLYYNMKLVSGLLIIIKYKIGLLAPRNYTLGKIPMEEIIKIYH